MPIKAMFIEDIPLCLTIYKVNKFIKALLNLERFLFFIFIFV